MLSRRPNPDPRRRQLEGQTRQRIETHGRKTSDKQQGRRRRNGDVSFHSLRHTAVTLLKEAGIPQAVVMELLGHDNEEMSQHYTRVGRTALEDAARHFLTF
ncbi:MAG TPA: tyrosine-type recombinase/integrase [Terrimicrobiaceae bacterium]|nr:tyrosine-type recombinase/integrase [Terrimicrobiaceae bacterium]